MFVSLVYFRVHVVNYNAFILFKGSALDQRIFFSFPFLSPRPRCFIFRNYTRFILCFLFLFFSMLNHTSALSFVYSFRRLARLVLFKVYSKCFIPLIIIINYYYQLHINSASFALFYLSSNCVHSTGVYVCVVV